MAVFRMSFGLSHGQQNQTAAAGLPAIHGRSLVGLNELTTSGTADIVEDGSGEWSAPQAGFITFRCTGAVWVAVGSAPTAAVGTSLFVAADERYELSVQAGDKVSVIDDS